MKKTKPSVMVKPSLKEASPPPKRTFWNTGFPILYVGGSLTILVIYFIVGSY